jgi:CHAT domain-containing protein/Tfp pilus assembly protein PilF
VFGSVLGLAAALVLGCASSPPAAPESQAAPAAASLAPAVNTAVPLLRPGVAVERDLPPGGRDELQLDLKAEFYVRLLFDAKDLDLDARLIGPGEKTVARLESSDGHLSAITMNAGPYRFVVAPLDPKAGGRYRLILEVLRPSAAGDADRVDSDAGLAEAVRLRSQGAYDEGIKKVEKALDLCRKLRDSRCEFEAMYEIGNSYISQGGRDKALLFYGQALKSAEAAADRRDQARVLAALGAVLTQSQKPADAESARPSLEQALRLWQEAGDSYRQSGVLYNLAIGRYSLGRFDEAIEIYQQALSLTDPAGALASKLWNGLGNVYASRGESLKALECFDTALRIAEEAKDKGAEAAALTSAGNIYQRRGEPQKAIRNFKSALEINQSDPALKTYEGSVLLQIGSADQDLGLADDALAEYQKALGLFREDGDNRGLANALWCIGRVDLARERPQDALEHLREALEIAAKARISRVQGAVLHEIGAARLKLRQFPEAVKSLEEALPLRQKTDRLGEASTRQVLGKVYLEQGDLVSAGVFLSDALKIADEVGAPLIRSSIHFDLARLLRRRDDLPKALAEIEQAISILEAVRSDISEDRLRTAFFASRRPYYDFWVDLLMELERRYPGQGYKDKALAASEKGRARGLLDLLTQERVELTRGIDPELRKREAEVKARLTQIQRSLIDERSDRELAPFIETLEASLEEADREQRDVEAEIKAKYPFYYQLRYLSSLERGDIQRLLPSRDSAILEYSLGAQGSYLFVVTTEGLQVHSLTLSPQEIAQEVARIGTGFKPGGRLPFSYRQAAYKLYEVLVGPARDELAGKHRLLIAPDGALNYLPFDALLTHPVQGDGRGLPYLIHDFSMSYIPSASVLSSLSLQRFPMAAGSSTALRFLAFAPSYGPAPAQEQGRSAGSEGMRGNSDLEVLPDLEGARQEVQEIAKRYRPDERRVYLGPEASRENVEKNPLIADRVHFAGHGLVDEEHPENSALVLSDGPLLVSDIFNLELKADLVVLSACRTAGKQVTGEGLVGLTRAFLYAGSPSVVVTLWQVLDSSTSDLMEGFYEGLDQTRDKAEALRQAKIGMIRRKGRLALPYYWAPFVLVGKPQ